MLDVGDGYLQGVQAFVFGGRTHLEGHAIRLVKVVEVERCHEPAVKEQLDLGLLIHDNVEVHFRLLGWGKKIGFPPVGVKMHSFE